MQTSRQTKDQKADYVVSYFSDNANQGILLPVLEQHKLR